MSETKIDAKDRTLNCSQCPAWKTSAFAALSAENLEFLERKKQLGEYSRGDTFSVKDQPAVDVYCLQSGSAKVVLTDEKTGRESLVRLAAPGEMLGHRCIFSRETFRGTASALTESVACKMSKDVIYELIERSPAFSVELLKVMGQEVAAAERHHQSFSQKNLRERLAELLLILRGRFGVSSDLGWRLNTRLTRQELSSWVGASREAVIRCLSDFIEEHLIVYQGDEIHVCDVNGLERVAGNVVGASDSQKPLPQKSPSLNSDL
jgi:CRP-like cAMP-binding protein